MSNEKRTDPGPHRITAARLVRSEAKQPLLENENASSSVNEEVSDFELTCVVELEDAPLSTDDETYKLPNLKHHCEKQYTKVADKVYSCLCTTHCCKNCCPKCPCNPCCKCCDSDQKEEDIRRRLKLHFMNPAQQCFSKLKGKCLPLCFFGVRLFFQLLTVGLVTGQIIQFGEKRSAIPRFIVRNRETINHLFLDFSSTDRMVVYSMDELYHQIQRVADTYYSIQIIAVAPYDYYEADNAIYPTCPPLLQVQLEQYNKSAFDAATKNISLSMNTHPVDIPLYWTKNDTCYHPGNGTIQSQLEPYVNASSIGSIIHLTIKFNLTSFFIDHEEMRYISCIRFDIQIVFDNAQLSGAIPVKVTAKPYISDCNDKQKTARFYDEVSKQFVILDGFAITVALMNLILCFLSILGDCILTCDTYEFFRSTYGKKWQLTLRDVISLQNLWFNGIIAGTNFLVIIGTSMKIALTYKSYFDLAFDNWTTFILGLGVSSQWCGLLVYLNRFDRVNMLLVTLRLSLPSAIILVVCAGVLFIAFLFLGWIVLGPYHIKFADPSTTSESLFSLSSGDDIFNTYNGIPHEPELVWIFSKIYLYIYVALFIYVVANVVIGLIFDTYQKLNEHRESRCKPSLYEYAFDGVAAWMEKRNEEAADAAAPQTANPTANVPTTTQPPGEEQPNSLPPIPAAEPSAHDDPN